MNKRTTTRRILETIEVTPEHLATKIVGEDPWVWHVACEGGCGRKISVAKTSYVPTDSMNPHGEVRAYKNTAPDRRRCALCGPFPKEA